MHNPRKKNSPRLPSELEIRQVPGHPSYLVSSDGRFWTTLVEGEPAEMTLRLRRSTTRNDKGAQRLRLYLSQNGRVIAIDAASLACEAFHGARPVGAVVGFADGNQHNLDRSNIGWQMPSIRIHDRDFVLAWQASYSITEVAEKLGISVPGVYSKAKVLVDKGVRLKHISGKEDVSVDELNDLIR